MPGRKISGPLGARGDRAAALQVRPVVDAVCDELGIALREKARRAVVEERVMTAWRRGPRQPLDLVRAGLDA